MLPILLMLVAVAWILTAQDVLRRRSTGGRKAFWLVGALVLPFLAIPVYWAMRPLPRRGARTAERVEPARQTLADLIPGWSPDRADACEQAAAWAHDRSHPSPQPSLYTWLRESGLAEQYPACAARLVSALLDGEYRSSFVGCFEVRALTALLERHVGDAEDVRSIKEQLLRLCPGSSPRPMTAPARTRPTPA
jgi:hypothetical protein